MDLLVAATTVATLTQRVSAIVGGDWDKLLPFLLPLLHETVQCDGRCVDREQDGRTWANGQEVTGRCGQLSTSDLELLAQFANNSAVRLGLMEDGKGTLLHLLHTLHTLQYAVLD